MTNSTFSGNSSLRGGGGIGNDGSMEVTNSTFSGNTSSDPADGCDGVICNFTTGTLKNTILANNTGGNCANVNDTPITDGGYNIDDGTTCGFSQPTSKSNTDPQFAGGLADNGGPTKTIALQPTSPAVNAIPFATNGCGTTITTDQRGVRRPQGTACDIGAFELEQASPPPPDKHKKNKHKKKGKKHHKKNRGGGGGGGGISMGSSQG